MYTSNIHIELREYLIMFKFKVRILLMLHLIWLSRQSLPNILLESENIHHLLLVLIHVLGIET